MTRAISSSRYRLATAILLTGVGLALALPTQGSAATRSRQATGRPGAAGARVSGPPRALVTRKLTDYLRRRGFQTAPGYPLLYSSDPLKTCRKYTFPALKNCFGANPAAPYVLAVVKSWPGEYVEPSTVNAFGPLRHGYSVSYQLDPREAIVIYGRMPPPGRYIGLQTYEWGQPGHWTARNYLRWAHDPRRPWPMRYMFGTWPPADHTADRVWTFSALGDIVNNVVMQRQSGYPFGKNRYFIITPSASTDHAVRRALHAQGVPDNLIFTEQIPSRDAHGAIGPLGMGRKAIDFVTSLRYAVPASPVAGQAWRSALPLTVLRVRAPASTGPVRRYGPLRYEPHAVHSEKYLASSLRQLTRAVCLRLTTVAHLHSTSCARATQDSYVIPELYDGLGWRGPYCRAIDMNCNGDNNDAAIFWGKPLPLDSGQVYAVISTLATQTRNATYVGLSISDASTFASPSNVLDTGLKHSADSYASMACNTGKFFVHYYARDCSVLSAVLGDRPQDCTTITDQMVPRRIDTSAVGYPALKGKFMVALRDYIVPGTERGANPAGLLSPRILTFTRTFATSK